MKLMTPYREGSKKIEKRISTILNMTGACNLVPALTIIIMKKIFANIQKNPQKTKVSTIIKKGEKQLKKGNK